MSAPLMPKATAIWLLDNTTLTFDQIAAFCHLHVLEIQAIADGEIAAGMAPFDPVEHGSLTFDEIKRCEKDASATLVAIILREEGAKKKKGSGRYVPVAKRADKPDALAWMLKHHPEVSDAEICRLLGTTSPTINAIRNKTHWNSANLKAKNPVLLGLCSQDDLNRVLDAVKKKID
ncbi:MAG: DUF1013 domain-containing protein [Alphaproteobacteria bacterium]|nr:DUF1013 domain-containing protein [Alphaproteobacteria bacterium]